MLFWLGLLRLAFANLRINKLRSALTVLGMVFGTGAVIATLSSSEGSARFLDQELKKIGVNLLLIQSRGLAFTSNDKALIQKYSPYFEQVSSILPLGLVKIYYGSKTLELETIGVESDFFGTSRQVLNRGRIFDEGDVSQENRLAVLGSGIAQTLFGKANAVGEYLYFVQGESVFPLRVVGVLKSKGSGGVGQNDDRVMIPITVAKKLSTSVPHPLLLGTLWDEQKSGEAKQQVIKLLSPRFSNNLEVTDAKEAIDRNKKILEKQNLVGISLALVSLLTGGVGIMNIMLLSVSQRRKEVGLRKAVGASNGHILIQFLLEAMIVCVVGGMLGICVGMLFGQRVAQMMGQWDAVVSVGTVVWALFFALATGIVFGIMPAYRAAQLDPYEALRS